VEVYPCLHKIDRDCFKANPAWAKQAFAYRLVHLLTPKALTKRLPKGLRRALIAPGVTIPPGVEVPAGFILGPGADLPADWVPWGLPEEAVAPPPVLPPGVEESGPAPPLYSGLGEAGPTKIPPPPPPVSPWKQYFDNNHWYCGANCTWTGSTWSFVLAFAFTKGILNVQTAHGWASGYRPTKIRVTYTGTSITRLIVRDTDYNEITDPPDSAYASGTERALDFTPGLNLDSIVIYNGAGTTVFTNIEFFA